MVLLCIQNEPGQDTKGNIKMDTSLEVKAWRTKNIQHRKFEGKLRKI